MSINTILKQLGCDKLDLYRVKGHAYHVFVYDDPEKNIFETKSVMVPFLSSLSDDEWVSEGKSFLKGFE